MGLLDLLARVFRGHSRDEVRVVRRVHLVCPHGEGLVEADLLIGAEGTPHEVLRCTARPGCPVGCDQECRYLHEAVTGPATQLILPPGHAVPDEED